MKADELPFRRTDSAPRHPMANPDDPLVHPMANPDDPLVHRLSQGPHGLRPEPYFRGLPGRGAILQGQVFVVGCIFIVQLWLVTEALYELLSGRTHTLGWLTLASLIGFLIALVVWRWPRHYLEN